MEIIRLKLSNLKDMELATYIWTLMNKINIMNTVIWE